MNIIHEINVINRNFIIKGSKIKIEKRGGKLYIRGSLPSKENKNVQKVQRISLGIDANNYGLEEAIKKLKLINLQLELDQFEWRNWITSSNQESNKTYEFFIKKINEFEKKFFKEYRNDHLNSARKSTWNSSYKPYIKRMINIFIIIFFININHSFYIRFIRTIPG